MIKLKARDVTSTERMETHLALALLLTGLYNSFENEANQWSYSRIDSRKIIRSTKTGILEHRQLTTRTSDLWELGGLLRLLIGATP